jgi:hypothetical protein
MAITRASSLLITGVATTVGFGGLYEAGYGGEINEKVCIPVNYINGEFEEDDKKTRVPKLTDVCEGLGDESLPPESNGQGKLRLVSELGRMIVYVNPVVKIKTDLAPVDVNIDNAVMFGYGDIVKRLEVDKLVVDWQTAEEDGLVLVTQRKDGIDLGIDVSKLNLKETMPENNLEDGKDDGECPIPKSSVDFRGCYYGEWFSNGFFDLGEGEHELVGRFSRIFSLKSADDSCLMMYTIPTAIREVLAESYNIEIPNGPVGASIAANILVAGMIKEQIASANGPDFPIQRVLVHLDPTKVYDPGKTYSQQLANDQNRLGNLTDADSGDDWCMVGEGNNAGVIFPDKRLVSLVHSAMGSDGWDFRNNEFDQSDMNLKRPAGANKYKERGYE